MKPRLKTVPLRLANAPSRLSAVSTVTPRLRGRAGVERRARWLRMHPLCVECTAAGRTNVADVVDHKRPLWLGGADDDSNLQSLCTEHHDAKTAREAGERGGTPRGF